VGTEQNPYQAYTDGTVYSENPLNLVVALYQGALDATRQAESALRAGDIPVRTKAINKALSILTELLLSLDMEKGGEIAQNLKRLYNYMQVQLLTAHARQLPEPIVEVTSLLSTLLEGWREAASTQTAVLEQAPSVADQGAAKHYHAASAYASAPVYGGYGEDSMALSGMAYSF
jgi:flagellar protein FliS